MTDRTVYIEIYIRSDALFDWRLVAGNGEIVCETTQGFTQRTDAERGALRAMKLMAGPIDIREA